MRGPSPADLLVAFPGALVSKLPLENQTGAHNQSAFLPNKMVVR
jgi:hypothetical protein